MRFRPRLNRLDQRECVAIIKAVTELCAAADLAWQLECHRVDPGFLALSERMQKARREGLAFTLPDATRHWFDLRYAHPDTAYSLALMLLWAFGNRQCAKPDGPHDHVTVALWYLEVLLPRSTHRALPVIATAYARHHASLPAQAHRTSPPAALAP